MLLLFIAYLISTNMSYKYKYREVLLKNDSLLSVNLRLMHSLKFNLKQSAAVSEYGSMDKLK